MSSRERRSWTEVEDNLLRSAVQLEDADSNPPTKWRSIAKHVPDRNNKDCRKRWFAKMASPVARGGWSPEEDDRLVKAIQRYGTRWSLVAATVGTRNNNQCAKRWSDTLSPDIDRTAWTSEEDAQLLEAVVKHGTIWAKIVKMYFPGRTGLSAKNRYTRLSRTSADLESDRHPIRRRSSSSLYDTLLANHSLLPPGVRHLRSADDTSLTPGSSSSSTTMDRQSSRTPEPESSRSVDQFGDEYLESKTIDNQSYQLPSYSRSETREADTSSDTDLFWGSPSTFPDALHPHTQQGFDYHYEAAHFDANPCPSQTPTGAVQPTSHFPDPDFFTSQPSLFTQPAYNIPCTVDFTHTRMTHPNGDILDQRIYGTDDVQSSGVSLPTLPSSSVPLFRPGTPDFSLFTLPAERLTGDANTLPALDLHKSLGDGAQSLTSDLAIPNNSSAPRRDSSPGDADASLMQTVEGHSYGDSQSCVTMASAHHGEQVTVAVALCDYKDIRVTVQSLVDTLRRR